MSRFSDAMALVEDGAVDLDCPTEDRHHFTVHSNGSDYPVPVDVKTGQPFCQCKRKEIYPDEHCKHELAAVIAAGRYEYVQENGREVEL